MKPLKTCDTPAFFTDEGFNKGDARCWLRVPLEDMDRLLNSEFEVRDQHSMLGFSAVYLSVDEQESDGVRALNLLRKLRRPAYINPKEFKVTHSPISSIRKETVFTEARFKALKALLASQNVCITDTNLKIVEARAVRTNTKGRPRIFSRHSNGTLSALPIKRFLNTIKAFHCIV